MAPLLWPLLWHLCCAPLLRRLIGPSDPVARDVLAIVGRVPGSGNGPIRWQGTLLGNVIIEGAYLYPVPATTP
jgi:hypothetical protein